ncbi:hypothetical protein, partial [Pseudomonas aeruginosa]
EILNQAVWDTAVAMDNISEFVEPDQGSVSLIKKLVEFAQKSGTKEGQALALQALAVLGVNYEDNI